jgi:hypothetical protein
MRFYPITIRTPQGTTQTFFVRAGSEAEARAEAQRMYGGQLGTGENQTQIVTIGDPQDEIPTGQAGRGAVGIMEPGGDVTRLGADIGGIPEESIRGESGMFQRAFNELFPNVPTAFGRTIRGQFFSPLLAVGDVASALGRGFGGSIGALRNVGPENVYSTARNLFSELVPLSRDPNQGQFSEDIRNLVNPQVTVDDAGRFTLGAGAQQAFNLARAGAADRLGRFTAGRLVPGNFNQIQDEFAASNLLPQQGGYLQFLQNRFGL